MAIHAQQACLIALCHTLLAEHLIVAARALQMRGGYSEAAALYRALDGEHTAPCKHQRESELSVRI